MGRPQMLLRLKNLPVDALANCVPVIRLGFDCLDDILAKVNTAC